MAEKVEFGPSPTDDGTYLIDTTIGQNREEWQKRQSEVHRGYVDNHSLVV